MEPQEKRLKQCHFPCARIDWADIQVSIFLPFSFSALLSRLRACLMNVPPCYSRSQKFPAQSTFLTKLAASISFLTQLTQSLSQKTLQHPYSNISFFTLLQKCLFMGKGRALHSSQELCVPSTQSQLKTCHSHILPLTSMVLSYHRIQFGGLLMMIQMKEDARDGLYCLSLACFNLPFINLVGQIHEFFSYRLSCINSDLSTSLLHLQPGFQCVFVILFPRLFFLEVLPCFPFSYCFSFFYFGQIHI